MITLKTVKKKPDFREETNKIIRFVLSLNRYANISDQRISLIT